MFGELLIYPALLAASFLSSIDKNFNFTFHKLIDSSYLWLPQANYIVFWQLSL